MKNAENIVSGYKLYEDDICEMSNLLPHSTGLKYIIWVITKSGKEKHGARIKVKINGELIPVSISDTPQVMIKRKVVIPSFSLLQKWIILNKEVLLKYWNNSQTMDMEHVYPLLKKVEK